MPKHLSQKVRYESSYGGGYISLPQFLAEMMCERLAAKDCKVLPVRFWEIDEWRKHYQFQVVMAGRLLKKYHPKAIFEVLNSNKKAYSINAKWLVEKYKISNIKYKDLPLAFEYSERKEFEQKEVIVEKPRESFNNKKSIVGKLDGQESK